MDFFGWGWYNCGMMKSARKSVKKKATRPRKLSVDAAVAAADRRAEAAGRRAEAAERRAERRHEAAMRRYEAGIRRHEAATRRHEAAIRKTDRQIKAMERKAAVDQRKAAADQRKADQRIEAMERSAAAERKSANQRSAAADQRMEAMDLRADRRIEAIDRKIAADQRKTDRRIEAMDRKTSAADRRMEALERKAEQRSAAADRRVAGVLKRMSEDHKKNEGHRRNSSRALEETFAASLPEAMRTHRIEVAPKDIRLRQRKGRSSREFDFVAPNGKLVLTGEVKARLTESDVARFSDALQSDFRELFPEFAGVPVYGVVAGGAIDDAARELARRRGFYILRMEGAKLHPETRGGYAAKRY